MSAPNSIEGYEKMRANLQSPSETQSARQDEINEETMSVASSPLALGEPENMSVASPSLALGEPKNMSVASPSLALGEPENMSAESSSSTQTTSPGSGNEPDEHQALVEEKEAALKLLRKRYPDELFEKTEFKKPRYPKGWKPSDDVPDLLTDNEEAEWDTSRASETSHLNSFETLDPNM